MNTRNILSLAAFSAFALVSGTAFAGSAYIPAGQGPIDQTPAFTSTVSRAEVGQEVAQARDAGQLVPAGQGVLGGRPSTASTVARATVKSETLQARANGDLVPAGEGPIGVQLAGHSGMRARPVAFARR